MDGSAIAFYIFAAITIAASIGVVGQRNPMHSVMLLIVSFGALAGLYVLLDAPFTAVTQIIIYAGAIMVLFLFVVMLLNVPREEPGPAGLIAALAPRTLKIGAFLSVALGIEIVWALSKVGLGWFAQDEAARSISSVALIGSRIFGAPRTPGEQWGHAFAFEATSILILVAMVGAVIIARQKER